MNPEEKILDYLGQEKYVPQKADEIVKALATDRREAKHLRKALNALYQRGQIARVKQERFCIPQDADLITGTLRFKRKGSAILIPDKGSANAMIADIPEKVLIRAEDTSTALPGDKVMARFVRERAVFRGKRDKNKRRERVSNDAEPRAKVIRILQRARDQWTGTLTKSRIFYYVIADEPTFQHDILVPDPATHSAIFPQPREGDKVVVKIVDWPNRHANPVGEITEVLGRSHSPDAEFKAILRKYHLSPDFPDAVIKETAQIPDSVRARDMAGRRDCRKLFTFTIDPDDAKDFDDALSIEKLQNGLTRIGVHIADVSAYVRRNSALDKEAYNRGNSTYLVGMVIPMLPYALSNGLCSLVEGEDRLTKSVFFSFDENGKRVGEPEFDNTVIRSDKRLSYEQAYALMKGGIAQVRALPVMPAHQTGATGRPIKDLSDKELLDLQDAVNLLWKFAAKIRAARMANGSLDMTMSEVKIYVDAEGYADRIEPRQSDESHELIEEYMLLANEAVARAFNAASLPYISRVHDVPDEEKLNEYRDYLANFGIVVGDLNKRSEVVKMLKLINNHPQGYALKVSFLRSMKQAQYRASADGHYGLNKQYYAHFTSPIRRYSDLIAHRIFDTLLQRKKGQRLQEPYSAGELEGIGQHISTTERNSVDAERESVKVKLLEYFEREAARPVKRTFDAVITDVRNFGFFVELSQSQAYGLVPVSSLTDDIYQLSPDGLSLVGRRTRRTLAVGSVVPVQVYRVDRFKREIDFTLAPKGTAANNDSGSTTAPKLGGQIDIPVPRHWQESDQRARKGRNKTPKKEKQKKGGGKRRRRK